MTARYANGSHIGIDQASDNQMAADDYWWKVERNVFSRHFFYESTFAEKFPHGKEKNCFS
jgi:hypothetical protein